MDIYRHNKNNMGTSLKIPFNPAIMYNMKAKGSTEVN